MKHLVLILLLTAPAVTFSQKIDKSKVKATDSLVKVVIIGLKTAEDFYQVSAITIDSTKTGFYWECRCKDKPPLVGDTITLVNPVLVDKGYNRKRNFLFH
jgi:hypothetical protein